MSDLRTGGDMYISPECQTTADSIRALGYELGQFRHACGQQTRISGHGIVIDWWMSTGAYYWINGTPKRANDGLLNLLENRARPKPAEPAKPEPQGEGLPFYKLGTVYVCDNERAYFTVFCETEAEAQRAIAKLSKEGGQ